MWNAAVACEAIIIIYISKSNDEWHYPPTNDATMEEIVLYACEWYIS